MEPAQVPISLPAKWLIVLTLKRGHEICIDRKLGDSFNRFDSEPLCTYTRQLSSRSILEIAARFHTAYFQLSGKGFLIYYS